MLTHEAYLARKWRSLPVLRAILESKTVPDSDLLTSIDETVSARLRELMEIAAMAVEHKATIRDIPPMDQLATIHGEIESIADELEGHAAHCVQLAHCLRELHQYLDGRSAQQAHDK